MNPELPAYRPADLDELLRSLHLFAPVLRVLPSTVFFVKNTRAEYVYANDTLLHRLQLPDMAALTGKTSEDLFRSEWGRRYTQQDREVLSGGRTISGKLELHTYTSGGLGWCITHKMPVYNPQGGIIAMFGVSVDVDGNDGNRPELNRKIALIETYIAEHFGQNIKMQDLERISRLSTAQIERYFKKIFRITPSQYIQKVRMEAAVALLETDLSVTETAARCGYADHSAFTRQFKNLIGISPSEFKKSRQEGRV
ncbi:AraC family transcriptional regulator [Neisseria leonii]|uniref:AraC family transcriptional regulator n=1 Tax=Neisseria leonii TaxID=2995413 RepID=UPI00237BC61D|nr:AraC family transcriptional regulator [Neisseria sp. 3986]MDD9326294.1 AraC family transcriptional regulator [Neisseria sp. 3986]